MSFSSGKIEEAGGDTNSNDQPHEFWNDLRNKYYKHLDRNRKLSDLWRKRKSIKETWEANSSKLGKLGGSKSHGQHSPLSYQATVRTTRFGCVRESALTPLLNKAKEWFEKQRSVGNHVDNSDLYIQYRADADQVEIEYARKQLQGEKVSPDESKLVFAIKQRQAGIQRNEKNKAKLLSLLYRVIGCKLLKPQRLIALSLEEEKARAWLSWRMYDYALYLVCFAPLEELGEYVLEPKKVRELCAQLVVVHSDQIPFLAKIRPGKQLYAPWEHQKKRKHGK